eukprot:SAG11_NODE_46_length_20454_cov_11.499386_8_plen_143_part_00
MAHSQEGESPSLAVGARGNVLGVGLPWSYVAPDKEGSHQYRALGSVLVYERSGPSAAWDLAQTLRAPAASGGGGRFGSMVAIVQDPSLVSACTETHRHRPAWDELHLAVLNLANCVGSIGHVDRRGAGRQLLCGGPRVCSDC